jgi:cell pole-organizing protein PopZ
MEEILASIRRIISEDDAPAETAAPAPAPEPESAPSPALMEETPSVQTAQAPEEDVLELTDRFSPATETIGDLDVTPAEPEPEPEPFPEPVSESYFAPEEPVTATPEHPSIPTPSSYDSLVGDGPAASAASAFAGLAASFRKPEPAEAASAGVGPTIDDLARQLLRPLLKEWLDANLPGIVEAAVKKEVERIARNAG